MSVQQRVTEEENSVGCYSASPQENLIRGVAAAQTINTEDVVANIIQKIAQQLKQNWNEQFLSEQSEQFVSEMPERFGDNKTW